MALYDTLPGLAPRLPSLPRLGGYGARMGSRQEPEYELGDTERESVLRGLARKSLGGISMVGNALDLPGSMVRDVLAGENPLDQILSPFSAENRVTGRQLGERWGMLGRNRKGLDWGDVGGFIGEVALDPLTYMTLGGSALSKAGQAAAGMMDDVAKVVGKGVGKRVGRMKATPQQLIDLGADAGEKAARKAQFLSAGGTDDLLNKPLGGLLGLGVPFRQPSAVFGKAGGTAEKIARGMDVAGEAIRGSAPIRHLMGIMHAPSQGRTTLTGQRTAAAAFRAGTSATHDVRGKILEYAQDLAERGEGVDSATLRAIGEGTMSIKDDPAGVISRLKKDFADSLTANKELGIKQVGELVDELPGDDELLEYMARYAAKKPGSSGLGRPITSKSSLDVRRKDLFRGFAKGTTHLEQVLTDKTIADSIDAWQKARTPQSDIIDRVADLIDIKHGNSGQDIIRQYDTVTRNGKAVTRDRYKDLADYIVNNPEVRKEGLFTNHVLADASRKLTADGLRRANATAIYDTLGEHASAFDPGAKLSDFMEAAGLDPVSGALQVAKRRGVQVDGLADDAIKELTEEIGSLTIPKDLAEDLAKGWPKFDAPESVTKVGELWDSMTNLFKVGVLTWPARYVRDRVSGAARNWEAGMFSLSSEMAAQNVIRGRAVRGAKDIPIVKRIAAERGIRLSVPPEYFSRQSLDDMIQTGNVPELSTATGEEVLDLWRRMIDTARTRGEGRLPEGFEVASDKLKSLHEAATSREIPGQVPRSAPVSAMEDLELLKQQGRLDATARVLAVSEMSESQLAAYKIGNALGADVNFFHQPFEAKIEGFVISGTRRVWINNHLTSGRPEMQILGHEIAHAIREKGGEAADDLYDVIQREIGTEGIQKELDAYFGVRPGEARTYSQSAKREEALSEIVGKAFSRPRFWSAIKHENPTLYAKIIDVIKTMVERFRAAFSKAEFKRLDDRLGTYFAYAPEALGSIGAKRGGKAKFTIADSLTDEEATKIIGRLYAQYGPGGHAIHTEMAGVASRQPRQLEDFLGMIPGRTETSELQAIGDVLGTGLGIGEGKGRYNPLAVRGVGGRMESAFGIAKAGDKVGKYTDDMNRLSGFIHQLKQGVDPEQAMRKVNWAQVNYDPRTFTPTERQLKRIFPFYSFMSRQFPYVAKELAERPGGKMSQTIQAMASAHDPSAMTPEYISDTAAIPLEGTPLEGILGKPPEGTNRYLSGAGLMFEDPLGFLGSGFRGAGLEALSRTNPLIKGPLEWATGQSFFQKTPMGGRPLEDLDPTLGRTISNITGEKYPVELPRSLEAIAANSPLTRLFTSARTASDPRKSALAKAMQLGTGFRIADVSPGAQDAMLQEQIDEVKKGLGGRTFTKTYIPEDIQSQMGAEEVVQAMQLDALERILRQRKKERRKST